MQTEFYNPDLILNQLEESIAEHRRLLNTARKEQEAAKQDLKGIQGHILACKRKNGYQYYLYSDDGTRQYLSLKRKRRQIQRLSEADYYQKLCSFLEKRIETLKRTKIPSFQSIPFKNSGLISMIDPLLSDNDHFAATWQQEPYSQKEPPEPEKTHNTDRGEKVRSKSEVLIANKLNRDHIPYRYEESLYLHGFTTIHPDFTVLNSRTREVFYWEHLGKCDDFDYLQTSMQRIRAYMHNGLMPGRNLIITLETKAQPLDTKEINHVIQTYLK